MYVARGMAGGPGYDAGIAQPLSTLVRLERAVHAAPPVLASAVDDLAMPLRRFLVAQRTGEVLTVNIERMMPAVLATVQWCNANGYKVNGR
jgi:hypothetical protein